MGMGIWDKAWELRTKRGGTPQRLFTFVFTLILELIWSFMEDRRLLATGDRRADVLQNTWRHIAYHQQIPNDKKKVFFFFLGGKHVL